MNDTAPRIIAFSGPKFSGKDTAASILLRQAGFVKMPFAGGVKNTCHDFFGWDYEDMEKFSFKETPTDDFPFIMPRWPMMDIANWLRDKYGGDIHVRRNARLIDQMHMSNKRAWAYVITDWRFPEETEWLNKAGALKIYIDRPSAEASLTVAQDSGDAMALNPSEMNYAETRANADVVLANDREIYNLQNNVMSTVRSRFGYWYKD